MEKLFYNTNKSSARYNVKLNMFEGPLDLLLHLIKKNRVDINDIPMSVITEQYLEYIKLMKELNLDLVGEYLLMAATLTHIKSRLLLPKDEPEDDLSDDSEDPRAELVRKLLDYQRYKEASSYFVECDMLERDTFSRGHSEVKELSKQIESSAKLDVSLFQLIEALKPIIARAKDKIVHEITIEKISLKDRINDIVARLEEEEMFLFTSLFEEMDGRYNIVITFLALLEIIKGSMAKIVQVDLFGPIRIISLINNENVEER
ncbi:segregation and condensation protein A [Thermodesulfobacteriota bacterium]